MISMLVLIRSEAAPEDDSTELPLVPRAGSTVLITMMDATTAAMVSSVVTSTLSILGRVLELGARQLPFERLAA